MKTFIKWERKVIEQAWMSQYLFTLLFDIPQVWLNCFAKLKFEDEAFINNLYEELLNVSEKKLLEWRMLYEKEWSQVLFTKYSLATLIMDLISQSMQDLTDSWKHLMTVYIDEEKETLKKYRDKTKWEIDILKEHVKNNEERKKQLDLENVNISKEIVSKTAWNDSEKSSELHWVDWVALTTTQESKPSPRSSYLWPTPVSLTWIVKWRKR